MLRPIHEIPDLKLFEARSFPDERGTLLQAFVRSDLIERGIPADFRQAIQSRSHRGVVRGLHFQWDPPQGKLIRCVWGRIYDAVLDIRHGSPALGDHTAVEMSAENNLVLWVPPGLAHGFMALEDNTIVLYLCTEEWNREGEGGILWNDPMLSIAWPHPAATASRKDQQNPSLSEWLRDPRSRSFRYPAQ